LGRGETNIVNKISDFKSWYYDSIGITIHLPTIKKEIVIKVRKKYTFIFFLYTHVDTHFCSRWTRRLTGRINDW
jgi:hypothetical protein